MCPKMCPPDAWRRPGDLPASLCDSGRTPTAPCAPSLSWTGGDAATTCPSRLRRVEVDDPDKHGTLVFLTNHLEFGATTIAAVYKDRWQIELCFKTLKQNLKIKTFVGTSANALKVQVWTALIAMLLLQYLQLRSRFA